MECHSNFGLMICFDKLEYHLHKPQASGNAPEVPFETSDGKVQS